MALHRAVWDGMRRQAGEVDVEIERGCTRRRGRRRGSIHHQFVCAKGEKNISALSSNIREIRTKVVAGGERKTVHVCDESDGEDESQDRRPKAECQWQGQAPSTSAAKRGTTQCDVKKQRSAGQENESENEVAKARHEDKARKHERIAKRGKKNKEKNRKEKAHTSAPKPNSGAHAVVPLLARALATLTENARRRTFRLLPAQRRPSRRRTRPHPCRAAPPTAASASGIFAVRIAESGGGRCREPSAEGEGACVVVMRASAKKNAADEGAGADAADEGEGAGEGAGGLLRRDIRIRSGTEAPAQNGDCQRSIFSVQERGGRDEQTKKVTPKRRRSSTKEKKKKKRKAETKTGRPKAPDEEPKREGDGRGKSRGTLSSGNESDNEPESIRRWSAQIVRISRHVARK
ncbi:hypothetical protein C8R45DRAFT_1183371 [Mycena sanguinolenta]|nr:hypothetical protein C8R45DRAFT_1183371 [Mycena sanguinolenta]